MHTAQHKGAHALCLHPFWLSIVLSPLSVSITSQRNQLYGMQALKAACDEAIAVLVSRTGQASATWERLLAAVVVEPSVHDDPSTGRYDISYQLAEIEVSVFMSLPCLHYVAYPTKTTS